ncbi:MAG: hypothetical protein Wins2KO_28510 [Winogradskyella sp.]
MRVLYSVFVFGHGNGGHFYSLKNISQFLTLKGNVNSSLVSIGLNKSKVLEESYFFEQKHHIDYCKSILYNKTKINKAVKQVEPEVIHCFDLFSYYFFRHLKKSYKIILTQCGGKNPPYYPITNSLIVFSKENYDYFEIKFRSKTKIYHLPNRVNLEGLVKQDNLNLNQDNINIGLISRIGSQYKAKLLKSIEMLEKYRHLPMKLYIIGTVQENDVYKLLKEKVECSEFKNSVEFLTDDRFTVNASKLVCNFDFMIASGRGVMEASCLGVPVLLESKTNNTFLPLDELTFKSALAMNFSPRWSFSDTTGMDLNSYLERFLINSKGDTTSFIKKMSFSYFNLESALNIYLDIYKAKSKNKNSLLFEFVDKLKHTIYLLNALLKANRH